MIKKLALCLFLVHLSTPSLSLSQEITALSLEQMNQNLIKIRQSVKETKEKIKTIRDVRFLPELYFALAEFYIEEAKYTYLIKVSENEGTPIEELDFSSEKRLKTLAIKSYDYIIERFPKLEERDEAFFLKAHELRGMGRLKDMVQVLGTLIREYPLSKYWEESQIIISDYFLKEKKDIDAALDILKQVTQRTIHPLTPIAYYKIGWLYINKDDFTQSLLAFEESLKISNRVNLSELPKAYKKSDIRREALLAMVWPYSEIPIKKLMKMGSHRHHTISYFYDLSPDPISYRKVLLKLGNRLTLKKRFITTTKIYFELLRGTTDTEKRLDIIENLYVSMKNTKKNWPVQGLVQEIVQTLIDLKTSHKIKSSVKKKALHNGEVFARDIATRQHQRAKRTRKLEHWQTAIEDYEDYLWAFPKTSHTKKIRINLAESYFNAHQYLNAAKEYEKIARRTRRSKKSLLDSSIQSYISSIRNESEMNPLEIKETRYGLRTVGQYFIKNYPNEKVVPDIIFNIAQTYYDERNFPKARQQFKRYIRNYPQGKNIHIAVHLILDSFNQVGNFKGLIKEGQWVLSQKKLKDRSLKSQVRHIVQQADLENVLEQAKDLDSSSYTQSLIKLAGKYKGSKLGDQALYQAFVALKAKKNWKAYKTGEQLILQHGNSKYAQTVTSEIVQMALTSADFRRAATYLELFAEKYPNVKESKDYLKNAASIRESMGDLAAAARNYKKLGDYHSVARMDYLAQNWSRLKRTAKRANGIYAPYWEGLAHYRLNGLGRAKKSLTQASQSLVANDKEREIAAHALYLLSMEDFEHYRKIKLTKGNETQKVNDKSIQLKQIEEKLNQLIQFGSGRWAIAGLHELGKSYKEFAQFIYGAPVPRGLSSTEKKQFTKTIRSQARTYEKTAKQFFKQCLQVASQYKIFTNFVKGCRQQGQKSINEAYETRIISKSQPTIPKGSKLLRKKLIDTPRNTQVLDRLASIHLKSKDFSMAELILSRSLEIKQNDALLNAKMGVVQLYKNDPVAASEWFRKSLSIDKNHPLASLGMAGLYKKYGYKKDFHIYNKRPKPKNSTFIHPLMRSAL